MAEYLSKEDMNTGEYISRDEALKIFHQCCDNCTSSYNGVMCRACADAGAMDILVDMPAADVQLMKHGRWIDSTFYDPCEKSWEQNFEFECSNCGHKIYNKPNDDDLFCGHCGARMDLKDGDTNERY